MSTASQADQARSFATLHAGPRPFVIPNPWDVGSARILAGLGFKALATTSAGMAFALGRRDGAVMREMALDHVRAIVGATPLPVSGDLENGYGDAPAHVAETIRLAAEAGLVGASIEDSSGDPARPIYDKQHAVERIAAAVEAARSLPFPFTLTARAENFLHGRADLDDTLARLAAFEQAGADVLYAPGLRDLEQIRSVCRTLNKPVNVLAGIGGMGLSVEQLAEAGAAHQPGWSVARAAYGALINAAQEMQERGRFTFVDGAVSMKELSAFLRGSRGEQRLVTRRFSNPCEVPLLARLTVFFAVPHCLTSKQWHPQEVLNRFRCMRPGAYFARANSALPTGVRMVRLVTLPPPSTLKRPCTTSPGVISSRKRSFSSTCQRGTSVPIWSASLPSTDRTTMSPHIGLS